MEKNMQRALVLGGKTGLLGQAIVNELQYEGTYEIFTLGREDGNIFEASILKKHLMDIKPEIIFNTVAYTQVDEAEENPDKAFEVNALFPETLAGLISKCDTFLVHISTDFVFSKHNENAPFTESATPSPESAYGTTKLEGEKKIAALIPQNSAIIRTAWLFGPGKKNFVTTILNAGKKNPILRVVDDQVGSPTYTTDLAHWTVSIAQKKKAGLWHAVNSGSASWFELAKKSVELANIPCTIAPIRSDEWPQKAKRPKFSVLNANKLKTFLHNPIRRWEDALADFISGLKTKNIL